MLLLFDLEQFLREQAQRSLAIVRTVCAWSSEPSVEAGKPSKQRRFIDPKLARLQPQLRSRLQRLNWSKMCLHTTMDTHMLTMMRMDTDTRTTQCLVLLRTRHHTYLMLQLLLTTRGLRAAQCWKRMVTLGQQQ